MAKSAALRYLEIKEIFINWHEEGKLVFDAEDRQKARTYKHRMYKHHQISYDLMLKFFLMTEGITSLSGLMEVLHHDPVRFDWIYTPHAYAIYRAKLAKAEQKTHERHYG